MTCPICDTPYERIATPQSAWLWRKRCHCKRPMAKVTEYRYGVRDMIRDEVRR